MNWRLGIWRIWLTLAAGWVIGIAATNYSKTVDAMNAPARFAHGTITLSRTWTTDQAKAGIAAFIRTDNNNAHSEGGLTDWEVFGPSPEEWADSLSRKEWADRIVQGYRSKFIILIEFLALLFIPPLALLASSLVAGLTVMWIIRGFRSK